MLRPLPQIFPRKSWAGQAKAASHVLLLMVLRDVLAENWSSVQARGGELASFVGEVHYTPCQATARSDREVGTGSTDRSKKVADSRSFVFSQHSLPARLPSQGGRHQFDRTASRLTAQFEHRSRFHVCSCNKAANLWWDSFGRAVDAGPAAQTSLPRCVLARSWDHNGSAAILRSPVDRPP